MTVAVAPIETDLGWAVSGDNLFRGYSVAHELINTSYWNMVSLAMDGPRLSAIELAMMDCICATMLVADPRIWPLKVAWLCGSYGSPVAGVAAAQAYFAAANVGPPPTAEMAATLVELRDYCAARPGDDAALPSWWSQRLREGGRITGFGVAGRQADERIELVRAQLVRLGLAERPYCLLQQRLAQHARHESQLEENVAGVYAAAFLDLGFSSAQVLGLMYAITMVTLWGSAWESAAKQPLQLRELPLQLVDYVGLAPRLSPRQRRRERDGSRGA